MTDTRPVVLVTGAAGFIGSTFVDQLLANDTRVVGIDVFEPFYPRSAKERNLAAARKSSNFRFVEVDTRDHDALMDLIREVGPTTIVDFAARAGVRDSIRDPWLYIDINVRGLQNTLSAAAAVGAALVFASSSSVYGDSGPLPFREDAATGRALSPYGATKIAGEALVRAHHALTHLPIRIARLFTVYGPRQRPDLAVYTFSDRMLRGESIPLFAEGRATRDFTYVGDIADALVRLVNSESDDLTVNLGGHRPYSNLDLVHVLERNLGIQATLDLLPAQPGDAAATFADIRRAEDSLGWTPTTTFEDGIGAFCSWFRSERRVDGDL
ncbi:MAG: NAD-dependent epimerase/dehydratase family protein [Chloroflexota bacterium]|nr:MAG: NAD-dependent epimerase/dehydratase family protein [Chloroflexota bacterium]